MDFVTVEKVIVEHDEGGCAVARLPEGYEGPCLLEVRGATKHCVGFNCVSDALSAARFAVGGLGGFYSAVVRPGKTADENTYARWSDWAFEA